jgi:hypothetical protein
MQCLGPSAKVERFPHGPCGKFSLSGMLAPSSQRSGTNRAASGPQTSGLVFRPVNGMMKLYGRVSIEFALPSTTHVTGLHRE